MKVNFLKVKRCLGWGSLAVVTIFMAQNCAKSEVAFSEASVNLSSSATEDGLLSDITALAYGGDEEDRKLLAEKIAGYEPPSMSEILKNWRRISGGAIYNSITDIDVASMTNSYCYSVLNSVTGSWDKTTLPGTTTSISPSTDSRCIDLGWFAALSWLYMDSPGRLHHATNSGNFNGFISGVQLDRYNHQAVLTSADKDDDEIALIIAATQDSDGNIYTLSASRSHGGTAAGAKNWRIVQRKNNTVVKSFGEMALGAINRNSSTSGGALGDGNGWNGRMTLVRVEREGDVVRAYASDWGTSESSLALDASSKIELDLSDSSLGLEVFQGKQYYGYGILSQAGSEFRSISFTAWSDVQFVYDLEYDLVYEQQSDGTYALRKDLKAFDQLGFPRKVGNTETQKVYLLNKDRTYSLVH